MDDPFEFIILSQLQSSLFLGSLSLIPNDVLRYTALAIAVCLALIHSIHLKRPSTQLGQLEQLIQKTEGIIRDAKSQCARDLFNLAEEGCRLLETETLTWKKYRTLSHDISGCTKNLKKIQTAVQLIVEAERQRKYTDDINQMEILLTSVRSPVVCRDRCFAFPKCLEKAWSSNFSFPKSQVSSLPQYCLWYWTIDVKINSGWGYTMSTKTTFLGQLRYRDVEEEVLYNFQPLMKSKSIDTPSLGPEYKKD
ncbi:hypothetical protein B0H17DRAFT_1134362 [Mycena rosella]|uniref:Uncharacterized protein n=1 Tax=Mycena rosella TaxID=1033263 RepID=A0AAD7DFA3_MYCRO|nr:hypothetical protein B0H17DRAFT_1134362 [Mycena rosella]